MATRRRSSKVIWMRSGWSSASICWVLLVSGRFAVSQTIIPEAQEHFLTPSAHRDTHIFGGLGLMGSETWPGVSVLVEPAPTFPSHNTNNPRARTRQQGGEPIQPETVPSSPSGGNTVEDRATAKRMAS